MNARPSALGIHGLSAGYGRRQVLDDITLAIHPGELLAVLGPSGCGKTTLLRSIAGLHRISAGSITIGEHTVARDSTLHIAPERRRVGLVPQEGALFPHLTVAANVGYGLRRSTTRAQRAAATDTLLDLVGLPGYGKARPAQLSGGQQQRIALARALAPTPAIVLLDEPFSALDAGLRATLRADVRSLLHERRITSVLVTHDQDEALGMADRVVVMLGGKIAQIGTPEEIYHTPATLEVGQFVGDSITVPADPSEAPEGWASTTLGPVPILDGATGPGLALIRPEQIDIAPAVDASDYRVTDVRFTGPATIITATSTDGATRVRSFTPGDKRLRLGDLVDIHVTAAVPVFPD
ncbi:ABC transporter ATP-binding protein [Lolliginicoccus suaedae]|uniref:ABC transporter ATP-binding protein n=1 Tax=Lolliginicoccus suaedae TaxID=2605429 RepID=UPI0011EE54AA|nr:ABC transporter ATP-binding protein [Lolliginicoccus suaedae]